MKGCDNMAEILVEVGSITSATRLAKRLKRAGDSKARVISTPAELGKSGCSYSVKASEESVNFIKNNHQGISVKAIYIEKIKGEGREYYDISR